MEEYQTRVIEEKQSLDEKVRKLAVFMDADAFLDIPEEDQELLEAQMAAMNDYSDILAKRIKRF